MRTRAFLTLRGGWTFAEPVPVRLPVVWVVVSEDCGMRDSEMGSTKIGSNLKNIQLEDVTNEGHIPKGKPQ